MNNKQEAAERIRHILPYVQGKDVIDVGGINHDIGLSGGSIWLHNYIREVAKSVIGIDILEHDVKIAREKGYNFIVGNAEKLDECTDQKFDVCVAGELIEHISNPGLFLDSAYRVLRDQGTLVLTTPNPFALGNILQIIRLALRRKPKPIHIEHKAWYDMTTLQQLVESHGFKVEKIFTVRPERESSKTAHIKKFFAGNANSRIVCIAKKV